MQCDRCGSVSQGKTCSTCESMAYAGGDAFTALCTECARGFVTADPNRDLCCFCMKRTGDRNGRNRRTHPAASRRPFGTAHQGSSRAPEKSWNPFARTSNPLKDARIRTGEIIGWRAWYAMNTAQGLRLRSMAVDCIWEPGEPISVNSVIDQCGYNDKWERIPPGIGAGVHAFKAVGEAARQYGEGPRKVYGTVALWGEVIEHQLGYRAEFGRVNSLDHLGTMESEEEALLSSLRQTYKVGGFNGKEG